MKYEYGNGIYELTEEEKTLIEEHKLFYADLFKFGNKVLDDCFDENTIKDYELTIYSNIYRIIELLDTLKAMNFAEIQEQGFIALYKREAITDDLHEACGFRTDYQFITKSRMKTIQKKSKRKE